MLPRFSVNYNPKLHWIYYLLHVGFWKRSFGDVENKIEAFLTDENKTRHKKMPYFSIEIHFW